MKKVAGKLQNPDGRIKKYGRLLISHRYNRLPLLPSGPGGVQQELVVQDLPCSKYRTIEFLKNQEPEIFMEIFISPLKKT